MHPRVPRMLVSGLALLIGACQTAMPPRVPAPQSQGAIRGPASSGSASADAVSVTLPNDPRSLKFAVLGDFGTGEAEQYVLARRMAETHAMFPFDLVTLVGDNIYGSDRPQDYVRKFEVPYRPLLESGVRFHAALGNHDSREQRFYEKFNMNGEFFYTFRAPGADVRFFALESTRMTPVQVSWLETQLSTAGEGWKIVFLHHPLYSSGATHGSDERLRAVLEPLFVKYAVSVVFSGHDHFYERSRPQRGGITYFVAGSGGKLRRGDARSGRPFSAKVVDDSLVFVAAEIGGDTMAFNAVSSTGRVVDSGCIVRVSAPARAAGVCAPGPAGAHP